MRRQDSSFYHYENGSEIVWERDEYEFYVVRNGEMRIHYTPDAETEIVIRYTDQLEELGIKTDEDLYKWANAGGDEVFTFMENSWFEVWHKEDGDYYTDAIHTLDEAIELAKTLKLEDN